jgi:hypothetical protein
MMRAPHKEGILERMIYRCTVDRGSTLAYPALHEGLKIKLALKKFSPQN